MTSSIPNGPVDFFNDNILLARSAFLEGNYESASDFLQLANYLFDSNLVCRNDDNSYALLKLNYNIGEYFRVLELLLHIEDRAKYPDFYDYLRASYDEVGCMEGVLAYYNHFADTSHMVAFACKMKCKIIQEFVHFQDPYDGGSESGESDIVMELAGGFDDISLQ